MIPNDPFVRLIIYLLLAGGAILALRWVLGKAGVPAPWDWVATLIIGILLILLAFRMAGLPLFAMIGSPYMPMVILRLCSGQA